MAARGRRRSAARAAVRVAVGRDHARLRPLDLGGDLAGCGRDGGVAAHPTVAEERNQHSRLAIEHARRLGATVGGPAAQLGQREGVERARGERAVDAQRLEPVDQLPGGACA